MYTTFIFEPALKKMNISGETLCCVCGAVCSNAHKCSVCLNPVHAICGVTGENEGYGCKVVCSNCNKRGVHASAVAPTNIAAASGNISSFEVCGVDLGDSGRNCFQHEICGEYVSVGDLVMLKKEVVTSSTGSEAQLELVVKVYLVKDATLLCHIGFLPRRYIRRSADFEDRIAIITKDLRHDDNPQVRIRSGRNKGMLLCRLVGDIEKHLQ